MAMFKQEGEPYQIGSGKIGEISPYLNNDLVEALAGVEILEHTVKKLELDTTFLPQLSPQQKKGLTETLRMMTTEMRNTMNRGTNILENILKEANPQSGTDPVFPPELRD